MSVKNKINRLLRRWNVELHGLGYLQSLAKGEFKKNEYDFFESFFENKRLIIYDIGANRGTTIHKFFNLFPSARIFAFEPIQELCNEIELQFIGNKQLKIECCGISDRVGSMNFHINKSMDTSSMLASKKTGLSSDPQVETLQEITVPVKTIEDSFFTEQLQSIDILKLDIQGSELKALYGAERLLKEQKIKLVYTEAYFIQQYVEQPLFYDIAAFLQRFGYQLQDIYNPIYGKNKLAWCDAVFIRNE